jgi:hypothetical protein
MDQEDALLFIVQALRTNAAQCANYGYELYIPNVIHAWFRTQGRQVASEMLEASPVFLNAAWELSRRGILRPGIRRMNTQATDQGSAGFGYSVTTFGRQWLAEPEHDTFIPTEPERFGRLLEPYRVRFGAGFHERAQEAVRCYGAHAYLACCAMCGAAAESIFLAAATARSHDQDATLRTYLTAAGRSRLENSLTGQASERLQREFRGLATLLKYWRDASSHGQSSMIMDNEAYTSLALLLRFAALVQDSWSDLTGASG